MNGRIAGFNRVGVGLLAVLGLALVMSGQENVPERRAGLVTDWTSRHLVFSTPSSPADAAKIAQDPRYWQQWARRNMHPVIKGSEGAASAAAPEGGEFESSDAMGAVAKNRVDSPDAIPADSKKKIGIKKDWSVEMSTSASMGDLNFPAKYSFSTTTASCNDYVAYNTGVNTGVGTVGTYVGSFSNAGSTTQTGSMTITNGATGFSVTLAASPTSSTPPNFLDNGNRATDAANFVTDISNYTGATELNVTVGTSGGSNQTITITGNSSFPLTFTNTISNLSQATNTTGAYGPANASIIAYKNIYMTTCSGVPTVAWSYNTSGSVTTSPSISLDGTQLVFVQNTNAGAAQLVMLKPSLTSGGTFSSPAALNTASSAANYFSGCATPCMYAITFALDGGTGTQESDGLAASNTTSSPWYDYAFDTVYVGDDRGYVHKFTGVFTGNPAEVTTGWPIASHTTATTNTEPLTSPVYDETHAALYFGDGGGFENWVNLSSGTVNGVAAGGVGYSTQIETGGIYDGPLVDPSAGSAGGVYQTVHESTGHFGTTASAVFQLPGQFLGGGAQCSAGGADACGFAAVSPASSSRATLLYTGTFDNAYYSGATTGHMYVCGTAQTTNTGDAELYDIPFTSSNTVMGTPVQEARISFATGVNCSSVTDGYNGTTDYIYTSVTDSNQPCSGSAGCVMSYSVTASSGALTFGAGLNDNGGSTGIIIDNFSSATGASQIYFSPLTTAACTTGSGGCAVQAAQGTGL